MNERNRRDRDGEPFENDLTDNEGATPAMREAADHDEELPTEPEDQSGDEFMREHYGGKKPED